MADRSKRKLKWGFFLFLASIVLFPLKTVFLLDQEVDKTYWCSPAHYSTLYCGQAQSAITNSIWSMVILSLALLVGVALLLDRFIMPAHTEDEQSHTASA